MEQKTFVKAIQAYRCRLNIAGFLEKLVFSLRIGAVTGIVFQVISFVRPLYYANLYAGLALLLAIAAAVVMAMVKRINMEETALVMDSFGFEERIVTAYGNLTKAGTMVELQRADAMRQLEMHRDQIRIALLPPQKKIVSFLGLLVTLIILALVPSGMKERAKELYRVGEEAREKTDEIDAVVDALEQLIQEETLTSEQHEQVQEMIERLQASQEEYRQASSDEMLSAASKKLEYRYADAGSQLASLVQSLQNGASVSPVTSESMQAMQTLSEKMQEKSGTQLAMQDTGSQNGQGRQSGAGSQDGQSGNQGKNGENGQDSDTENGRGTGTSSTPHDYVSIPNDIADSENLTGNIVDHNASAYFHAQNGLSWEGEHISYEAVIGSYEQNAYEGIAAGKYPSGMEEIIKEYFSSFD